MNGVATTCGATRPPLAASGWVCDGSDLVVVLPAGPTTPPVVIRRDLIPYVDDPSAEMLAKNGEDFPGGDHFHIRLPIPLTKPRGVRDDAE